MTEGYRDADARWLDQAVELRSFLDEHDRLPGSGADASDHERRLARWVKSQREAEQAGRLASTRAAWLDQCAPAWRQPRAQTWHTTAIAVGLHVAVTGEYPSASADDPETRRLGTWLRTQRRAHRDGRLDATRAAWLDLNLPFWASPVVETWFGTAECVAEFVAEHGRMPRAEGPADGRADEGRLARWLRAQRAADRAGRLDDEQRAWLDATVAGWRSTREANWERTATELARFLADWNELPAASGPRPGERRLASWLGAQRAAAAQGALSPQRRSVLDARVPGWEDAGADRWNERLTEAAAFVAEHGRLPSRAGDADEPEHRIATWIAAQRRAERDGRLPGHRRERLDAQVPGWSSTGEAAWRARAAQLAAFAATHGRLPAVREPDPDARGLAVWLGRQRALASAGRLDDTRERWLRLHVPGWRDHNLGAWLGTAERVVAFRAEHGRLPTRAATSSPLERELGVWLNNQRNAERAGRLGADRRRWLAEQLPDWHDSRLGSWLGRAMEVEQYLAEQGRLPHPRSTNPRSRRLGGWLDAQRGAQRAGRLRANRAEWLDAHLPGWAEPARRTVEAAARPAAAADVRSPNVLREWVDRLRAREDLPLRAEQRAWLERAVPGWDQQTA